MEEKIYKHTSVLTREVLTYLSPQPHKLYVDVTFGGGGHSRAILEAEPTCTVLALDLDTNAIEHNAAALEEQYPGRFRVVWGNFAHIYKILKKEKIKSVDGFLADFGTSQFQIHNLPGFSFQTDTPLDMRMSTAHEHATAAHIVNHSSEKELLYILQNYGEERRSRTIARAIVERRKIRYFRTTKDLIDCIESTMPGGKFVFTRGVYPATQTFQALRIAVNHELVNIELFLKAAVPFLSPQGRIVCISFHSLEDRIVKNFFKEQMGVIDVLTPKPVMAQDDELKVNPSSRSAKLRAAMKI
jgi:16S rRNA (cytosine1402-N4)-methyltransferase